MPGASSPTFTLSPVPHAVRCLASVMALAASGLLASGLALPAAAQTLEPAPSLVSPPAPDPLGSLKASPMLAEQPPQAPGNEGPTFVFGDRISGRPNLETVIDGNAELRRGTTAIRSDRLEYFQPDDLAKAKGNVRISASGNQFQGDELEIKLDTFEGFFTQPSYQFLANGGNGQARRIEFIDDQRMVARNATYTTCQRGDEASWKPAWQITGTSFRFDQESETGMARGAVLRFKDVPILGFPAFSFPLSDRRKSGLLPPTIGLDSISGFQLSQPYYLNIAPNRDATITPTIMSKRGVDLAGEFRYLESDYAGQLNVNAMPGDKLRQRDRWSYALQHTGVINTGTAAVGNLGLNLNLNRVSDNDYWRDFSRSSYSLTERLLPSEASLNWGKGNFSTSARILKYQTLQDINSPIVPPYDRLPQLTAAYTRIDAPIGNVGGFDWSVDGDFSRFSADKGLTRQPNADRLVARAQLARPFVAPGWFFTPKVQLNSTRYSFDAPLANGRTTASRTLPTYSLDSGLQFERNANFLGRGFTQTLEPRAFYVRTPFRDQRLLPNYDSAASDFNFASIFSENEFIGNDRISDANLLTLGATSRLIDPDTGAEALRFAVAQRLRFSEQRVTLPGVLPIGDRVSDLLVGTSINWVPEWTFDSTVQYNPKTKQSERSTVSARYAPSAYRVVSAALRRQRDVSNLVDVAWQWPINDLWGDKGQDLGAGRGQGPGRYYGVGRLNYSIPDRKLVDSVLGIEYDGCCWVARVVLQRSQSSTVTSNTRILFQLELVGFSRLGSNPLATLRTNIPRYQNLRGPVAPPSRFTNYD